jgi:8-oxo-dGTP pyrophosphatase MutT (NUDIX family)
MQAVSRVAGCQYGCAYCAWLYAQGVAASAAVLPINLYDNHRGKHTWVALGGLERSGPNAGSYTLACGKVDPEDHGCIRRAAIRELAEEYKLIISFDQFDSYFMGENGQYRCVIHRRTPVFYTGLPGLSRNHLNPIIAAENADLRLPSCRREMERVDWIRFSDHQQLEGNPVQVSPFLRAVMRAVAAQIHI